MLGLEDGTANGMKLGLSILNIEGLLDGNSEDQTVGVSLGECDGDLVEVPGGMVGDKSGAPVGSVVDGSWLDIGKGSTDGL